MIAVQRTSVAVAALIFALTALTAQAGQAGSRNDGSRSVQLRESAVLSGVTIRPGSYTLSWARERGSEEVRVAIARGRTILATGNGRWIESAQPSPYEALVYHAEGGPNELAEIRFKRSADSIRIDAGTTRSDSQQSNDADGAR